MAKRTSPLPLEGIRILDFTVQWAGPYATHLLALWGAEVVRVESTKHFAWGTRGNVAHPPREFVATRSIYPDNDPGHRPWNRAATFNDHGRNKLSMTVDLTRPEGQEILRRLVRVSDGVMENNVPVSMERVGVTWEALSIVNPQLVMVRQPAFGLSGPYKNYRAWGSHMEALAGHPMIRAYPDLDLTHAPSGVTSDGAGGVGGAFAFLMGLRHRRQTGHGLLVEIATAENFIPFLGDFILDYSMNGRLWERQANRHPYLAPHNVYPCPGEDRWLAIAVCNEDQWQALCRVIGDGGLAQDPRFAVGPTRWQHRDELDQLLAQWTGRCDPFATARALQEVGVPAGVVMNERDVDTDPHLNERGFWEVVTHPEAGTHRYPAAPWKASKTPTGTRRYACMLGEDNEYVYKTLLGFSDEEYHRFEEMGHIGMDYDPSVP